MKMRVKNQVKMTIIVILAFTILIIELLPILLILLNSFKTDVQVIDNSPFYMGNLTLESFKAVLSKRTFITSMKNSLLVGVFSTLISITVGAMASYGIARFNFRFKYSLSFGFLVSRMIPQISLVIAFYMMFRMVSLNDTILSLVLAHCSFNIPYIIWVLLPFFSSIPVYYEEAAFVDGCSRIQIFYKVFVPLAAPGIVVASIFAFMTSWNEFLYALVLTGFKSRTAPIIVVSFLGEFEPQWGKISAAGILMLLPIFIFTLSLQRFIIRGLSAGGVKG